MNKHPKLSFCSVRHLEIQPCWTAPGQACWLPLEGWRRPSSETINNRTHKQRRFWVRAVRSACSRTRKKRKRKAGTHAGGQQLFTRSPEDVGKVLHEIPRGLEDSQDLLVGSRYEAEPPDRRQALHVVAVDLRPGDLVPVLLPDDAFW